MIYMTRFSKKRFFQASSGVLLAALLAGCTTPTKTGPKTYTFFPPKPDEPRVQFLMSFASDADFGRHSGFLDFITGEQKKANPLVKPYGLALKDGKIYVCDTVACTILVFDLQKKRGGYFAPQGEGLLQLPVNISIDEDGTRYVADTGRNQILIYDKDGLYLGALGLKGEMRPTDVAVTADRLYITDLKNHSVQVYSKAERKRLFSIPLDARAGGEKLFSPTNLAVDKEGGRLLVSDTGAFHVQVYDLEGKYLRTIGGQGTGPGLFARPKGVAADRAGRCYVVDAATQVVQVFDAEGKSLLYFGYPGASGRGELILPAAVKVDYDHAGFFQKYVAPGYHCEYLILVTSQFGGQKVGVYGFLKKT